jgi:hypothetical protein
MAAKRELMTPKGDKRYVRRDAKGRIKEVDDVGRSLAQDRRRKASKTSGKGQGDKGDRAVAAKRKTARATPAKTARATPRKRAGTTARKRTRAAARKPKASLPAHRAPIVA